MRRPELSFAPESNALLYGADIPVRDGRKPHTTTLAVHYPGVHFFRPFSGLEWVGEPAHGLRRGLYSVAAPRLIKDREAEFLQRTQETKAPPARAGEALRSFENPRKPLERELGGELNASRSAPA